MNSSKDYRSWEYERHGDYHKNLDPNWSYTPTYLIKMNWVDRWVSKMEPGCKILDAGCGEGVLIEKYQARGYKIEGIDLNYSSHSIQRASVLDIPYESTTFDAVLFLDVFEHLSFAEQPLALAEIHRVLKPQGSLIISIPNLAHLESRFRFLLRGKLSRTDIETNHIGERPIWENLEIINNNGFQISLIKGITLTLPLIYRRIICEHPARFKWLHDLLNVFAFPSIAMLNILHCKSIEMPQDSVVN